MDTCNINYMHTHAFFILYKLRNEQVQLVVKHPKGIPAFFGFVRARSPGVTRLILIDTVSESIKINTKT